MNNYIIPCWYCLTRLIPRERDNNGGHKSLLGLFDFLYLFARDLDELNDHTNNSSLYLKAVVNVWQKFSFMHGKQRCKTILLYYIISKCKFFYFKFLRDIHKKSSFHLHLNFKYKGRWIRRSYLFIFIGAFVKCL